MKSFGQGTATRNQKKVQGILLPAVQTQRSGPIRPDELMNHPGTTPVLPRPDDGVSASQAIALKTLLVPVDFSAASWPQLHFSKVIARQFHAQIDIVHVVLSLIHISE